MQLSESELEEFCASLEIGHTVVATASQYEMTEEDCLELPAEQQRRMKISVHKYVFKRETEVLEKIESGEIKFTSWNIFNELAVRLPQGWGRSGTPRGSGNPTPSSNSNPALQPATDFFDLDDSGEDVLGI